MANKILETLIRGGYWSAKACNNSLISLYVTKLIEVGGVIRRLLNALKPLSFRLERGCA